jgi:hypothetical protein
MPALHGAHTNKMTSIDWRWFKEGLHDMLLTGLMKWYIPGILLMYLFEDMSM